MVYREKDQACGFWVRVRARAEVVVSGAEVKPLERDVDSVKHVSEKGVRTAERKSMPVACPRQTLYIGKCWIFIQGF